MLRHVYFFFAYMEEQLQQNVNVTVVVFFFSALVLELLAVA